MAQPPQLRAADSDRERAAADLREHYAAGRLTEPELGERLDRVYAATTVAELDELRADLPDPRPLPVPAGHREIARRRVYQDAGAVVIADIAAVVIWAATGADASFWPKWVILVSGLRLLRDGWRLLGPAAAPGGSPPELGRSTRRHARRDRRL
jgi:hypothetical protein